MNSEGLAVKRNWETILRILIVIGIVGLSIKYMFFDFDVDTEYAIALSYRLAKGDRMFLEMWEPHQTSAFVCAFFIRIWLTLTGTTTGIVVYLHFMSLLVKLGIGLVLYRTLRCYFEKNTVFWGTALFLIANPKMLLLEFSNLQVYASVLLFCFLLQYFERKKRRYLVCSALALCLEVLAYPSCLLVYVLAVGILFVYSDRKWQDILLFTSVCAVTGAAYLTYFLVGLGSHQLVECFRAIILGDGSHSTGLGEKFLLYGRDALWLLGIYFLCAVLAFAYRVVRKKQYVPAFFVFLMLFGLCNLFIPVSYYGNVTKVTRALNGMIAEIYPPLMCLGWRCADKCVMTTRRAYRIGTVISLGGFLATLLLTNLNVYKCLDYLILGAVVAFLPLFEYVKSTGARENPGRETCLMLCGLGLLSLILKNGYLIRNNLPEYINTNILQVKNVVREGPAIGIVSTYMWPYITNVTIPEWKAQVQEGDNVLIVGAGPVNTLPYLYQDVNVCVDSTICTPTYNEKLLRYWELNPDKQPNVVVVECWFGQLRVSEDSWIMQWISEEFGKENYVDGTYYRFYRR